MIHQTPTSPDLSRPADTLSLKREGNGIFLVFEREPDQVSILYFVIDQLKVSFETFFQATVLLIV